MARMKTDYRPVSLADQVFERLEADILGGRFQRGEMITELQLCAELGVSRAPVHEALRRLEQEHLVEDTARGIMVLGIVKKDFEDMCAIRLRIEGLAVQGFIDNMTEETLRLLREAVELQKACLGKSDADRIKSLDTCFHEIIYQNCGSTILADTLSPLHKKVQKFRRISIEQGSRAEISVQEHWNIYNAIAARNGELAEKLMNEHVGNALQVIIEKEM